MSPHLYAWPLVDHFVDRDEERRRLEAWWDSPDRMPINLYGRRRVGKSWLLRRFAHGKPAVVLVAERLAAGSQLTRFAEQLAPLQGGVVPDLPDVATLFRTLYRLARASTLLVIVDEFPRLLGTSSSEIDASLSVIQAVMEEEQDSSRLKLVLCGSAVAQMEALQAEESPLHGRLVPLEIRPLELRRAALFLPEASWADQFERFAIAGGMPRYLNALATGSLKATVCRQVLEPDAPLWNEGRTIVGQELREPGVHFAILEQLASGPKQLGEVANAVRLTGGITSKYLSTLERLRLVGRRLPVAAPRTARGGHWELLDPFLRFWFRFVFPYQADLEAGLRAEDLYESEVAPSLSDHVAAVFEESCRNHARQTFGKIASRVGRWWGNALHEYRRTGSRSSEEIDIVGITRNRVTLVGEAKWTSSPVDPAILNAVDRYKIPALEQAGFKVDTQVRMVLYSRAGFTDAVRSLAADNANLVLISGDELLAQRAEAGRA